jgi:hypothetical protein
MLVKSSVASSATNIIYQGTAANCKVSGMAMTDVNFTATDASMDTNISNWYGGTLLRCGNAVFTVTAANATAGATYTNNGQTFTVDATITGGTTLRTTMQTSTRPLASGTLTKTSGTGDATITFSAVTVGGIINRTSADFATAAQAASILSGTTISGVAGSFVESDRNTDPGEANVKDGTAYRILNANKTGSYVAGGGGGGLPVLGGSIVR